MVFIMLHLSLIAGRAKVENDTDARIVIRVVVEPDTDLAFEVDCVGQGVLDPGTSANLVNESSNPPGHP